MARVLPLLFFGLLISPAWATPMAQVALSPGEQCRAAIAAAEKAHGIPPQLLSAIGRVESGRRDPVTGVGGAWPWTINAEGQGYYFDTKAQVIAQVEALRARGVRSIDVGCMQVNLKHHAAAFPDLEQAFEPGVNADYAARFLLRLYEQTRDWTKAAAHYHSANPVHGEPYAAKVMAVWPDEQRKAGLSPAPALPQAYTPSLGPVFGGGAPILQNPPVPRAAPLPAVTYGQPGPGPLGGAMGAPAGTPAGRGLDAYRAMPIRMAGGTPLRVPPRLSR